MVPSEKIPKEATTQASKKKDNPARKLQRPQTDSTKAVRPEETEGQSAPSQPAPLRLRTPYPEAPAPGAFPR
jgi:hypothetical protein